MGEKDRIAPCGLDCTQCPACADGDACAAAKTLLEIFAAQDAHYLKQVVLYGVGKERKREREFTTVLRYLTRLTEVECRGCKVGADKKYCSPDCSFLKTEK